MTSRLSTKGQLVIPKRIRERHGWRTGTELEIEDRGDCLVVRPAAGVPETTLEDLFGCTGYDGPRRSLRDMEAAVGKGARAGR